jgi:hypothetical protein
VTEIKVGDRVKVVRDYGNHPVGHVGVVTDLHQLENFCARVDDEWNYPIDSNRHIYLKKIPKYMENK